MPSTYWIDQHSVSHVDSYVSLWQNGRGNPAAAFDIDVSKVAIGGLGSPLGSSDIGVTRQFNGSHDTSTFV